LDVAHGKVRLVTKHSGEACSRDAQGPALKNYEL